MKSFIYCSIYRQERDEEETLKRFCIYNTHIHTSSKGIILGKFFMIFSQFSYDPYLITHEVKETFHFNKGWKQASKQQKKIKKFFFPSFVLCLGTLRSITK